MSQITNLHIYNSNGFISLNSDKADEIINIEIKSAEKTKLRITFGVTTTAIKSPFSAPFGGPDIDRHVSFHTISELINRITQLSAEKKLPVEITFPPLFYNTELSKFITQFLSIPNIEIVADINYHIELNDSHAYLSRLTRSAKKNLNQAWKNNLTTILVSPDDIGMKKHAYDILWQNRQAKGRELKMTFKQLQETSSVVDIDYFMMTQDNTPVASAICYHVATGIVQVIYWGHNLELSHLRPMNQLAYDIFCHYYRQGIIIVDVGPASLDGVHDEGLCNFKENIGCIPTVKYRIRINPIY